MAASKNEPSEEKNPENQHQNGIEQESNTWESFEEDASEEIEPIEGPLQFSQHASSENYLESLENKLKKLKGNHNNAQLTAKQLLQGLKEAKESQLARMVSSDNGITANQEAYIVNEEQVTRANYCSELYRHTFPVQPINKQETECLIQPDEQYTEH